MRKVEAAPRASVLIESMRDIGYSLETALADIIDNSIAAAANRIDLFADTTGPECKIAVLDNGGGMSEDEIVAAMRLGSKSPLEKRAAGDLGRFGLGLKTASFSQCRRLTVVSRQNGQTAAAVWDFAQVAETNDWLVEIPDNPLSVPWTEKIGEHGTLVLWEQLDRVVPDTSAEGLSNFTRLVDEARAHLELVFHRFLAGEPGQRKLTITLNGRKLEAFDPFNTTHIATIAGPVEVIRVGGKQVTVQTYTLPHHQKMSQQEWERYGGRAGYLRNQGFYVYRQRRLIIHGTWFGLARQMELTKLARVRIDMPNGLDAEWKIDVKKASAQPPYQVRERLRRIIETIGANSKRVYTSRGRRLVSDNRLPVWLRVEDKGQIVYRLNPEHPVFATFSDRLPEDLKRDFGQIVEIAASALPMDSLFADLGGDAANVGGTAASDETLEQALRTITVRLRAGGVSTEDIEDMLRFAEPFRSNWERTEAMLHRMGAGEDRHE